MVGKLWCVSGPSYSTQQALIHITTDRDAYEGQELVQAINSRPTPSPETYSLYLGPKSPVLRAGLRP